MAAEESQRRLVTDAISTPKGYHQITTLTSAVPLQAKNARFALIQAVGQNVRWRDDGTDPTSSVGMILFAGQTLPYYGDLKAIRLIETAASAELNVSVYY
jgi:hypothetical protein